MLSTGLTAACHYLLERMQLHLHATAAARNPGHSTLTRARVTLTPSSACSHHQPASPCCPHALETIGSHTSRAQQRSVRNPTARLGMSSMAPPPIPRRSGQRRGGGDAGVQKTNDDAQATKLSSAQLGYFKDEVLPLLARCRPSRKPPLINRGTWARHVAVQQVLSDFVAAALAQQQEHGEQQQQGHGEQQQEQQEQAPFQPEASGSGGGGWQQQPLVQVVVLGAGSDSAWFNAAHQGWQLLPCTRWIELDFPEVMGKKARAVLASEQLLRLLPDGTTAATTAAAAAAAGPAAAAAVGPAVGPVAAAALEGGTSVGITWCKQPGEQSGGGAPDSSQQQQHSVGPVPPPAVAGHAQELVSSWYSCCGADLRLQAELQAALARAGFDARLPTLYVCECLLVYLEPPEAEAMLAAAAAAASSAGACAAVVIYEQTRPADAFGATMLQNLEARGCPLRSVASVPSPAAQEERLLRLGWTDAAAADMAAVYYSGSSSSASRNGSAANGAAPGAGGFAAAVAAGGGSSAAAAAPGGWLRKGLLAERARIERLELLDELEEWRLLQEHYCLALGVVERQPGGWLSRALQLPQLRALARR